MLVAGPVLKLVVACTTSLCVLPNGDIDPVLPEVPEVTEAEETEAEESVWDILADCESNQRWDYNGSSGFDGGLQFHPDTWTAFRPEGYPQYAWQASREQEIVVAEKVLDAQGWGAWPACSRKLGLR